MVTQTDTRTTITSPSSWLPVWFLIVTSPLVYTAPPFGEAIKTRRPTIPLWDFSILPVGLEVIWLWLALAALAWLTIANAYYGHSHSSTA